MVSGEWETVFYVLATFQSGPLEGINLIYLIKWDDNGDERWNETYGQYLNYIGGAGIWGRGHLFILVELFTTTVLNYC